MNLNRLMMQFLNRLITAILPSKGQKSPVENPQVKPVYRNHKQHFDEKWSAILALYEPLAGSKSAFDIVDSGTLHSPRYSKEGEKLYDLFYQLARLPSVEMESVDIGWLQEVGIEQASMAQLKYFMFDFTASERTHEGLFGTLCASGVISRLIVRLKQLNQSPIN